jgi:myosin heavy subunit
MQIIACVCDRLQLCAGADADERERWRLRSPDHFHFVNQSGCYDLKEVAVRAMPLPISLRCSYRVFRLQDVDEYKVTRAAMTTMGITADEQVGEIQSFIAVLVSLYWRCCTGGRV